MATLVRIERIKELFCNGKIAAVNFTALKELSNDVADKIIVENERNPSGKYQKITDSTKKYLQSLKDSGQLPILESIDLNGITENYALGLVWLAGSDSSEEVEISPKQRVRIKKLIARGLLRGMSDHEISLLSVHAADVLIRRASAGLERVVKKVRKEYNRKCRAGEEK